MNFSKHKHPPMPITISPTRKQSARDRNPINRGSAWTTLVFTSLALFVSLSGQGQNTAPISSQGRAGATAQETETELEIARYAALHPTLAIGSTAPDFSVTDPQGKKHQLSEYKSYPILAIVFTCAHCPYAQAYEDRIQKLYNDYTPKGVALIVVNPNANSAMAPSEFEWTDVDDSLPSIAIRQKLRRLTYPYFYDGDTQSMALKYGPQATPHMFIFDKERKLQYQGRIDNAPVEARVTVLDARAALDALVAGKPVAVSHTPVFGCNTKWSDITEDKEKQEKAWQANPVTMEPATAATLKALRANSAGKTLMVTFWSTKCARCAAEFPDLLATYRWYKTRAFDMVTVSTDGPSATADVQKFLDRQHSAVRNLNFASADTLELQKEFDGKTWDTTKPFTVVIGPNGNLIYQGNNGDDILHVRREILANFPRNYSYASYWQNNLRLEALESALETKR